MPPDPEDLPPDDIPLVRRPADDFPPDETPPVPPDAVSVALPAPRPGFWGAVLWTLAFATVIFGSTIAVVAAVVLLAPGGVKGLAGANIAGGEIPRGLAEALGIGFIVGYGLALVFSVVALRVVNGRGWGWKVGLGHAPPLHLGLVVVGLPGFMLVSAAVAHLVFAVFGRPDAGAQEAQLKAVFDPFPWWFAVLAVGVMPGVVEELWCRGFLGRGLVGRYGFASGVLLTSLFFGMLHLFPPWYVLVTAAMGVMLHLTYLASRSLWVPIVLHMLNNSFAILAAIGALPFAAKLDQMVEAAPVQTFLLGFALTGCVGYAMWTGRVTVQPDDRDHPAWSPPFPGVELPPPGEAAVARPLPANWLAVLLSVALAGTLVYLGVR